MEGVVALEALYRHKRVLVTGHTGFKGAWLCQWLADMGATVTGYALAPEETPDCLYSLLGLSRTIDSHYGDIRDIAALHKVVNHARPDMVFHLAAQSLVLPSYEAPLDTFSTNIMGTLNVLECVRGSGSVKAVVNITTDKCYENNESAKPFRESDPLGGHDPYSSSKAAAEIVSAGYRHSFLKKAGIHMATARAGNVIGGGDFAAQRILPDIVRAAKAGDAVAIRHPESIRPWQHVLDVLHGYLMLGQALLDKGNDVAEAFNFGPDEAGITVGMLTDRFTKVLGHNVAIEKPAHPTAHEARTLMLDTAKAKNKLGWKPALTISETIDMTGAWYKTYLTRTSSMAEFSKAQLAEFRQKANA